MPLIVENNLPAKDILEKENIFIMEKDRAKTQDIRPVRLAIVNLMPNKEETELQILRALSNTPLQVNIDLVRTETYKSKNTEEKYLERFYKDFSDIKNDKYDGMIITGAPVEKLHFEEVVYWKELSEIFEFARENVYSTMFICWASQAALYYYYDIPKYVQNKKIFGVYDYEILEDSVLTKGFDDVFYSPQSRYAFTREEDVKQVKDLKIISSREDTGVNLISSLDNRFVFIAGHNEYSRDTLHKELIRDRANGLPTETPINYFRNDQEEDGIIMRWKSHGSLLFSNWLNYCVYQETPYDINKIKEKKVLKFGGSSLSDSRQFKKVKGIINSDSDRNLVVVSAPGKRYKEDIKITDLLIGYCQCQYSDEKSGILNLIRDRYYNIVKELSLDSSIFKGIDDTINEITKSQDKDFIVSRGEYLSGLIMAKYLNFTFLDPKDIIFFDEDSNILVDKTYSQIKLHIKEGGRFVIPGFYGTGPDGKIKTFSRGGSDITGSLVASALKSDVYENWTDVDGLMDKDPNKYDDAKLISKLSYDDFLQISLHGDQVYHIDAIRPVMDDCIPINIRNTNNPDLEGTLIGRSIK